MTDDATTTKKNASFSGVFTCRENSVQTVGRPCWYGLSVVGVSGVDNSSHPQLHLHARPPAARRGRLPSPTPPERYAAAVDRLLRSSLISGDACGAPARPSILKPGFRYVASEPAAHTAASSVDA